MKSVDRANLARRTLLDTLRVANLLDRRGGALARQAGVTSAQWLSLGLLVQVGEPGLTPTELCKQLCVSKQNMTGMILRLENKGLAERRPEPQDRRSFRVCATAKGAEVVNRLDPAGREFFLGQVADLDDPNLEIFADNLAAVLERLRREETEAQRRRPRPRSYEGSAL
jgi:DNA-binding MarR family transcriptional regulator